MNTISFCTSVMNRLDSIKQTLPYNLDNIKFQDNSNIIIFDYGSSDGLSEYIKENYIKYIDTGKLIFLQTEHKKEKYWHAHCKNVPHFHATSDIVSCVDADSYISGEYIRFIMKNIKPNTIIEGFSGYGMTGYITMFRDDFSSIGGYDEEYKEIYGSEDHDIIKRGKMKGMKVVSTPIYLLKTVIHDNTCRTKYTTNDSVAESLKITRRVYNRGIVDNKIMVNTHGIHPEKIIKNFDGQLVVVA